MKDASPPTPPPVFPPRPNLLRRRCASGHFDELHGSACPPENESSAPDATLSIATDPCLTRDWALFFENSEIESPASLTQQSVSLAHQIRDNGVTYNVYADQGGPQRPWSLDLFPVLIDADTWPVIEAGVVQRMRLLEKIMADVYGPQQTLAQGWLPPALVFGHPGYERAMHGIEPVGGNFLHMAAFDLARGPDGKWWVIGQRCQAPSGLGYLLENRLAISSQFPQAFQTLGVQRLASTYRALMDGLKKMSPAGEEAHLALLTPGPYNETYFEHAYLARYLGLSLVEGSDLVVRQEHLFLKTLKGLVPVHGLIKRVDDHYLDPLELRADSSLGVPGLMQAIRAGNVLMANAPGSAFLESPALLGFMPALSQHLLGEDLNLPALPTWWCGENSAMTQALSQLSQCAIKSSYPGSTAHGHFDSVLGQHLSPDELEQWSRNIQENSNAHTVQAHMPLSQLPTWRLPEGAQDDADAHEVVMRSMVLRVFAVSDGPQSWRVLPGGLARIAGASRDIASMQRGGSSADVWALTRGVVDRSTLLPPHMTPASLAQRKRLVTSRAAENLFWLGRYTERAENAIRLVRLTLNCLHGEDQASEPLLDWLSRLAVTNTLVSAEVRPAGESRRVFERAMISGLSRLDGASSVGYYLNALKLTASSVRDRLSQEHWRLIVRAEKKLLAYADAPASDYTAVKALELLTSTGDHMAAITGAQTDRMTRDDGWRLLSIGRHIERLSFLADAMQQGFDTGCVHTDGGFDAILALFDSTITFHAQFRQSRDLTALMDLLVLDRDNPRSLAWVAHTLRGRLAKLAGCGPTELSQLSLRVPDPTDWHLAQLCEWSDAPPTMGADNAPANTGYPSLMAVLTHCTQASCDVSDAISTTYFTHAREPAARAPTP